MRYYQNPFKVEHLDFLIVDRAIRYTPKGRFTEEDGGVIALYNFFGRWFSRQFIIDRINYINEVSQKEGKHIPSFMDERLRLSWGICITTGHMSNRIRKRRCIGIECRLNDCSKMP